LRAYLDTSALLKLFVEEEGSVALARQIVGATHLATTCRITYAEARAALARRERESPQLRVQWAEARRLLDADWSAMGIVEVDEQLVQRAGDLADAFALRAYDAVQLAACDAVRTALSGNVVFYSFDLRLNRAARLLGLHMPPDALS
jgi:predicted nucleic acid-binding protein